MKLHAIKPRTFVFHVALVALYIFPAIAVAAVPSPTDLLRYHSGRPSQSRHVVVTFANFSLQPRELRIGSDRFQIAPRDTVRLNVTVGGTVQVYSSMNSQLNGTTVATISDTSDSHQVVIH